MTMREEIIRQIVERDLNDKPLTEEIVERDDPSLHASACEHFGTWETALQYAGISIRRATIESGLTPDRIIRRLRKMCVDGYDMSASRNIRRDRRLYEAARHHFGSWRKSLIAAGIDVQHVRKPRKPRKLDRQEIIQTLRDRHEAGLTLKCTEVCLENRDLATAAINAFNSWGRALAAAGLGPPLPDEGKIWNREKIIADIQERHRSGKPCNYQSARVDDQALVSAARRYFGNWRTALTAAGIKSVHGDDS